MRLNFFFLTFLKVGLECNNFPIYGLFDIAIDKISILGGPITSNGSILTSVIPSGTNTFEYSIEGCSDNVFNVNEIDAGDDFTIMISISI